MPKKSAVILATVSRTIARASLRPMECRRKKLRYSERSSRIVTPRTSRNAMRLCSALTCRRACSAKWLSKVRGKAPMRWAIGKSVAARWPRWPSSCAYRRKVGLIRKRSCGRSPVNHGENSVLASKAWPRSVMVREVGRSRGRNRSRLLRDRCHRDAANFVYVLASGAFSSNQRG